MKMAWRGYEKRRVCESERLEIKTEMERELDR